MQTKTIEKRKKEILECFRYSHDFLDHAEVTLEEDNIWNTAELFIKGKLNDWSHIPDDVFKNLLKLNYSYFHVSMIHESDYKAMPKGHPKQFVYSIHKNFRLQFSVYLKKEGKPRKKQLQKRKILAEKKWI